MKTTNHLRYSLLGLLFLLFGEANLLAQTCAIEVVATPTKALYSRDELIDVTVTLTNQGGTDELLRIKYPTLQYAGGVNLTLEPTPGLVRSPNLPASVGGLNAPTTLPARRALKTHIYLQRFLEGFKPGHYEIPWQATTPCLNRENVATAQGVLRFDVFQGVNPNTQTELSGFLNRVERSDEELLRQMQGGPGYFTETPFTTEEAVEGLRLNPSPLAIPFLTKLAAQKNQFFVTEAFNGLSKFTAETEARRFVLATVESDKVPEVAQGLRVLSLWKEDLPESELRALLSKKNTALQVEVLHYIGRTQKRAYRGTAETYTEDANPEIATAARQALTQLTK